MTDEMEERFYERVRKIEEQYPLLLEKVEDLSRGICRRCQKRKKVEEAIQFICKVFGYTGK